MNIEPKELTAEELWEIVSEYRGDGSWLSLRLLAHIEWQRQEIERLRHDLDICQEPFRTGH